MTAKPHRPRCCKLPALFLLVPTLAAILWLVIWGSSLGGAEILQPGSKVVKVARGGSFTEGPVADRAGHLFFSDGGRVMRLAAGGKLSEFAKPEGNVNGMMFDAQGRLYLCQHGADRVARLGKDGKLTVLATACDGFPLANPNDIAIDRRGRIFFTDTSFQHGQGEKRTGSGVLRIDPDGKCVLLVDDLRTPNGIIISPDEGYIFVSDRGTQKLHRYAIRPDGSLQPDRIVYDFTPDRGIDGMCIDVRGNIYGAAGRDKTTGLFVISPDGELLLHHLLPEFATNATFGGEDLKDLYVTAGGGVYRFRTVHEGTASPLHQSKSSFAALPGRATWKPHAPSRPAKPDPRAKRITNSIGMKLVRIEAGAFRMGSPAGEEGRQEDEQQHQASIPRSFYLSAFEVTQQEYQRVMRSDQSHFTERGVGRFKVAGLNTSRFPIERVSRDDAIEFCRRLSELPQEKAAERVYRLPTEAEWEYACRAGARTVFGSGDALSSRQANFNGNTPYGNQKEGPFLNRPATVGSYQPNAWGLYDMHGNVWEWCADAYARQYDRESPAGDPAGRSTNRLGVIRGGSWVSGGSTCRSANRHFYEGESRNGLIGFRVVCQH